MSKSDAFWTKLSDGSVARVVLSAESERPARRTRIVRTAAWSHYAGYDPSSSGRPRCRARGCTEYLKRSQAFACSQECETAVRDDLDRLQRAIMRAA